MKYPILSSQTLRDILNAISQGKKEIEVSFDLGYSHKKEKLLLYNEGFIFKENKISIPKLREDDKSCYLILEDCLEKVQYARPDGAYKLIPTKYRPILQISGTSMHKQAFVEKVKEDKLTGKILDSGTGLGYTAIVASKTAKEVITIEKDEMVLEIQKINPFSSELFTSKNINLIHGDLVEEIKKMKDKTFDFVILDGGTPRSSGEFFSINNYEQVFRVLKRPGKLYHYIPNYHEKRGVDFAGNISKKLRKLGFKDIQRDIIGSYIVATKV